MSAVPPSVMSSPQPISAAQSYRSQFDLAYQISPIILTGGIAANVQGGKLPITLLRGMTTNGTPFARYLPMPGSTLLAQSVGMYPFANQAVAANATIQQPLTLSMLMIAPVNEAGGFRTKLHAFSALQKSLQQHNASGGMYTIATPAFIYEHLLMTAMTDVTQELSADDMKQLQIQYQLDFIQPLVTLAQAQGALGAAMQKITNGSKVTGAISYSGNQASSPANLPGVAAALGNVESALSSFGGSFGGTP